MTLKELRDKRQASASEAKALVEKYTGSQWTPQINAQYENLLSEVDQLDAEILRHQRIMDMAAQEIHKNMGRGSGGDPKDLEHREAFEAFARTGDDLRLRQFRAEMTTSSGTKGGYLIPSQVESTIDRLAADESAMRAICDVKSIDTPEYKRITSLGGTVSGWVGETEARPETDTPTFDISKPYWGTIYAYPLVSQDQLDFSGFDLESFLQEEVGTKFGEDEGESFITGDGVKKPRGILDFPFSSAPDAIRPFGTMRYRPSGNEYTFDFDALKTMCWGLKRKYRKNARWLMNSSTAEAASKIKNGEGDYMWRESKVEGQPDTLMGYPVELDDFMPDVDQGVYPILFGDFKKGFMIVNLPSLLTLRDPYSNKPYVGFYFLRRVGTMLKNSEAICAMKIALD